MTVVRGYITYVDPYNETGIHSSIGIYLILYSSSIVHQSCFEMSSSNCREKNEVMVINIRPLHSAQHRISAQGSEAISILHIPLSLPLFQCLLIRNQLKKHSMCIGFLVHGSDSSEEDIDLEELILWFLSVVGRVFPCLQTLLYPCISFPLNKWCTFWS